MFGKRFWQGFALAGITGFLGGISVDIICRLIGIPFWITMFLTLLTGAMIGVKWSHWIRRMEFQDQFGSENE